MPWKLYPTASQTTRDDYSNGDQFWPDGPHCPAVFGILCFLLLGHLRWRRGTRSKIKVGWPQSKLIRNRLYTTRAYLFKTMDVKERRESVVECLTPDWENAGSSITGVTALCSWSRHINPCLVLVQPRKTPIFQPNLVIISFNPGI